MKPILSDSFKNVFAQNQQGFRSGLSTETNLQ